MKEIHIVKNNGLKEVFNFDKISELELILERIS